MKQFFSNLSSRSNNNGFNLFFTFLAFFLLASLFVFPLQEGHCAQVTLTWDPNNESDLAGYEIFYGTSSGNYQWNIDIGNVTTYTLNSLNMGVTYYIAATAYNTQGLQSGFSNEVVYTVPSSCTYTISPSSASFSSLGGSGSVLVTTQAGCNWGTSESIPWITINSGSGMGSGTMSYTVSPNAGATRSASFTIAGNVFMVTEADLTTYTITASAGAGGSISPSAQVSVLAGARQAFTITPNTGYQIAEVIVDGVSQGSINSYSFSSVSANHTITASFTLIGSPVVSTETATSITLNSATLNGTVNPNSLSTSYIFQWGTTVSYGNSTAMQLAGNGTSNVTLTANLTGLTANTLYHYRLVATNSAGTTNGTDATFVAQFKDKVDFNNDGKTDILWRNKENGDVVVWYMNGATLMNGAGIYQGVSIAWDIVGTGDFNNDGKTDILWRNKKNGDVVVWYMNGATLMSGAGIYQGVSLVWDIVGTGDFNNDGKTDILWRNKKNGDVVVWYMNGATLMSGAGIYQGVSLVWDIVGTGDFNNDGKTDILWRNKKNGDVVVWYMNGATLMSGAGIYQGVSLVWDIVGTGDFNNDGKTDILWRNKENGDVVVWYMNGATLINGAGIYQGVSLVWEIAVP